MMDDIAIVTGLAIVFWAIYRRWVAPIDPRTDLGDVDNDDQGWWDDNLR